MAALQVTVPYCCILNAERRIYEQICKATEKSYQGYNGKHGRGVSAVMADSVIRQRTQPEGEDISSNEDDNSQSDHEGFHTDSDLTLSEDDKDDIRDIDDEFVGRKEYIRAVKASGVGVPCSYILRNLPTTHLSLKNRSIGLEATRPLCHALKNNLRVEMLDLQGNDLGFKGASLVMEMLLENVTICHLNLAENNLGNVGARAVGNTLPRLNLLIHLSLSGNKIGDSGMETMAPGIALNTSVERLNLSYNEFEERGGKLLGGALAINKKLRHLDLSWNNLRGTGGVAVFRALKTNTTLTSLNLSMNGLGYEGSVALLEALRHNSTLTELDVSNNRINWDGARIISRGLRHNMTLAVLKIGDNPLTTTGCHNLVESVTGDKSKLKLMDCSNVCVIGETVLLAASIRAQREFRFVSGRKVGSPDKLGQSSAVEKRPMGKMLDYIKNLGVRPLELLRTFDKTATCEMPRSEFIARIKNTGIQMYNFEIETLADKLATKRSVDGVVNYRNLIESVSEEVKLERHSKIKERERKQKLKEYHKLILQRGTPEDMQDSAIHMKSLQDPTSGRTSFGSRESSGQKSRLFTVTQTIGQLRLADSGFKQENTGIEGINVSKFLPKQAKLSEPVRFLSMTAPPGHPIDRTNGQKSTKNKKKLKRVN